MITKYTIATLGYSQEFKYWKTKDLDYNPEITLEEGIKSMQNMKRKKKNNRS